MTGGAGWIERLRRGLGRSSARLGQGISDILAKRRLDAEALVEIEELLIAADLGAATAGRLAAKLGEARLARDISAEGVKEELARSIAEILAPYARPLVLDPARKPFAILVVGVNGSGKTTTIGRLAKLFRDEGKTVTLAAGDTFRAAAVQQLKIWGERAGCPVVARDQGADAAGLVHDALSESRARGDDVLLIDTAGRLHNKSDLMAELGKILRVMRRIDPSAPHEVLLVLDATVGQNAHNQVEVFREMTQVTGLAMTKLDGTAKGGVLVGLAERFALPIRAIGVGEGIDDLRPFDAEDFAHGLVGLGDSR